MNEQTKDSASKLSLIHLPHIFRYCLLVLLISYALYELVPRMKSGHTEIPIAPGSSLWYLDLIIWMSDLIVIYTWQYLLALMAGTVLYTYLLKNSMQSFTAWIIVEMSELSLLVIAIGLLLAWGFSLEFILLRSILLL